MFPKVFATLNERCWNNYRNAQWMLQKGFCNGQWMLLKAFLQHTANVAKCVWQQSSNVAKNKRQHSFWLFTMVNERCRISGLYGNIASRNIHPNVAKGNRQHFLTTVKGNFWCSDFERLEEIAHNSITSLIY